MIRNFWKHTQFYCCNAHETPLPMTVSKGDSYFYSCSHYMAKDKIHPDGHEPHEPQCFNRLSFDAAQNIVNRFMTLVEEDLQDGCVADYTGYKFKYNGIDVTILKYRQDGDIWIGILNRKALKS